MGAQLDGADRSGVIIFQYWRRIFNLEYWIRIVLSAVPESCFQLAQLEASQVWKRQRASKTVDRSTVPREPGQWLRQDLSLSPPLGPTETSCKGQKLAQNLGQPFGRKRRRKEDKKFWLCKSDKKAKKHASFSLASRCKAKQASWASKSSLAQKSWLCK